MIEVRTIGSWLERIFWLWIKEPRVRTLLTSFGWLVIAVAGGSALMLPPVSIEHKIGPTMTIVWASLLLVGGSLGYIGALVLHGWWWVERTGIITACTGGLIYFVALLGIHGVSPGNRIPQACFVLFFIIAGVIRYTRIMGSQTDPNPPLWKVIRPRDH